jgi:HAD superfamily hydrolase (TIGR01490 family)
MIVVFDLDGTLTCRDSFLAYLFGFLIRHPWRLMRTWRLPWLVLRFFTGGLSNSDLKQSFLQACLGDVHRGELQRWTATFLDRLIARGLCSDGLIVLERHRRHGDVLILLSASLDLYVEELGRRLAFNHVICTKTEWQGDILTGVLASANRYGEEKLRCLKELKARYGKTPVLAYADHHSDIPLLRMADYGTLVNGTARARRLAAREGITRLKWER